MADFFVVCKSLFSLLLRLGLLATIKGGSWSTGKCETSWKAYAGVFLRRSSLEEVAPAGKVYSLVDLESVGLKVGLTTGWWIFGISGF